MNPFAHSPWIQNSLLRRSLIVLFSCVAILTSAGACAFPGITSRPQPSLGVLKRDPAVRSEGFGRINAVSTLSGEVDPAGLSNLSGLKMIQVNRDTFYLITQQKGVFKTTDGGRVWRRLYVFEVTSNAETEDQRQQERQQLVARNDQFIASDLSVDPSNENVVYISGKYQNVGKIYQSVNGGGTFREIYSEVQRGIGVLFVAVNPRNNLRVYGMLERGALIRSLDGGATWQKIRSFQGAPVQLGFVPEFNNRFFILFRDRGLFTSQDDGETWQQIALTKNPSEVGEAQPRDQLDVPFQNTPDFGVYEKVIPVTASQQEGWLLMADRQIWFTPDIANPFSKLVLPLQNEQFNILDVEPDPQLGLRRLYVSIDSRLFVTTNQGQSWNTGDLVQVSGLIGNIGQVLIDKTNSEVIYLMLVPSTDRRGSGVFGGI